MLALLTVTTGEVIGAIAKKKVYVVFFAISAVFSWILTYFYYLYDPNDVITVGNYSITAWGIENLCFVFVIVFEIIALVAVIHSVMS